MNVNVNHPSVMKFLSDITNTIASNSGIEGYFEMTQEKKTTVWYTVFKIIKNVTDKRVRIGELEFRALLVALWKKNEENENYEIAAILNDINKNFDLIKDVSKPIKTTKKPKTDTKSNE